MFKVTNKDTKMTSMRSQFTRLNPNWAVGWCGGGLVDPRPQTFWCNFLLTYRIGLKFPYFPKMYLGKFCQSFSQFFLTKVILVKLKILYILMERSKCFVFFNIFLYCKIIISFLGLFSATCFLCILQLQTQLVFWYFVLFGI